VCSFKVARGVNVLACVFKETMTSQIPSMDVTLNNGTIQEFSVETVTYDGKYPLIKTCFVQMMHSGRQTF
jgi:hypothetical protein